MVSSADGPLKQPESVATEGGSRQSVALRTILNTICIPRLEIEETETRGSNFEDRSATEEASSRFRDVATACSGKERNEAHHCR